MTSSHLQNHADAASIAPDLLRWYDRNARDLPWRSAPGSNRPADPYRVWLSEIMLQQTTVAAVKPYFADFTARWPDVHALAAAPDEAVLAAWAGLGYYARARNLIACARMVATAGGRFPETEVGLRDLPGVGTYTAAAIAAIGFGQRAVVVDANVERVVSRLFAIADPLPGSRPLIRASADAITPDARAGDFAQAMMDLGSALCIPRDPACPSCPLQRHCAAQAQGIAGALPAKAAKKPRPERQGTAFWIESQGQVLLVRRPRAGMLGGMRALPDDGWAARRDGDGAVPLDGEWRILETGVKHVFSHFSLTLRIAVMRDVPPATAEGLEGTWWPVERIGDAGLPTLFAKAAHTVQQTGWRESHAVFA